MIHRLTVAMAWLLAIGSTCFALGSLPMYFDNVSATVTPTTFFVGSLFFTSAGYIQYYLSINVAGERRILAFRNLTRRCGIGHPVDRNTLPQCQHRCRPHRESDRATGGSSDLAPDLSVRSPFSFPA